MRIRTTLQPFSGKLDIAPIVDVVFLLLIFFALSSSFVFHPGLPVDIRLPRVKAVHMHATEKIVVVLTGDGGIYLNDKRVESGDLERELTDLAFVSKAVTAQRANASVESLEDTPRSPKVLLLSDASVPYHRIVEVMSLARSLNLGVFLATDPESGR